jgi:predicted nucleic acid-binding protein
LRKNTAPRWNATTPASKVVDSWALLAWLRDEKPAAYVRNVLQQAEAGDIQLLMSWINAGEVYYMLARKHNTPIAEEFLTRLPSLPIRLVKPDEGAVIAAARLKSMHKISHADAFAAALAQKEDATLITGDPELKGLSDVLEIEWIGPAQAENRTSPESS